MASVSNQGGVATATPTKARILRNPRKSFGFRLQRDLAKNWFAYVIFIPIIVWYIVFCYLPMWGIVIGFYDYRPLLGLEKSQFVGLKHFKEFFNNIFAKRIIANTIILNLWGLIVGFPAPIILALLLNEVHNKYMKKTVQTITYLPHFISLVVICGMIHMFTGSNGFITQIVAALSDHPDNKSLLGVSEFFRPIYTFSGIWQNVGWDSIIYLAAMSAVAPELYESADLDGASRIQKMWHITIPTIAPTIVILLIFAVGGMLGSGHEKIILLYNHLTMDRADVIASYVYRLGVGSGQYSFTTAVGLFSAVINFILLIFTNMFAKKFSEITIW